MVWPVMCVIDGTWVDDPILGEAGQLPAEFGDFLLMRAMGWTWSELEAVPVYVRRYCCDFLNLLGRKNQEG